VSELRNALFTAAAEGDADALESLCRTYLDAVLAEFPEWTRVPEELRADQDAIQWWVAVVMRIAQQLDSMGHPEPLERITGGNNPIVRWQRSLLRAEALNAAGERDDAAELIRATLEDMEGASGSAVTELRPKALGQLATIYFHRGDLEAARRSMTLALDECRAAGDVDGVRIYTENLATLDAVEFGGPAADRRTRIAHAQDLSDAARYRASNELLGTVLDELEEGDSLHAKACGLLGLNLYRLRDLPGSRRWTERALEACRRLDDEFGVTIYSNNLEVIDRTAAE
jgi:hypothetical protein